MRLESKVRLWEIQQAVSALLGYVKGRSSGDLATNRMLKSAVEREFQIIGEAIVRLRRSDPATAERIPFSREIVGFRNVIVHEYDRIDEQEVWSILESDLQPLVASVESLLAEPDSNE